MNQPMTNRRSTLFLAALGVMLSPSLAGIISAQVMPLSLPEGGLPLTMPRTTPLVSMGYDLRSPLMAAPILRGSLRVPVVRLQPAPAALALVAPIASDVRPDIPGLGKSEPAGRRAPQSSASTVRAARASLAAMGAAGADASWIWSDFWLGAEHHFEAPIPDQPPQAQTAGGKTHAPVSQALEPAPTLPPSPSGRPKAARGPKAFVTPVVSAFSLIAAGAAGVSVGLLNFEVAAALLPLLILAVGLGIMGTVMDPPSRERRLRLAWSGAASVGIIGAAAAALLLHNPQLAGWTAFFSFVPATLALKIPSPD